MDNQIQGLKSGLMSTQPQNLKRDDLFAFTVTVKKEFLLRIFTFGVAEFSVLILL